MRGRIRSVDNWEDWVRRVAVASALLAIVGGVLFYTPTSYYITAPGAAIDTSRLITVQGGDSHRGKLYMLVLNTQPANLFWYLYAQLDRRADLETKQEYLGSVEDYSKYLEMTRKMMSDSQRTARAIALKQLGYGRGVIASGVRVTGFATGSLSLETLQEGDLIVSADGRPVATRNDLQDVLLAHQPGDVVTVGLRRDDQELTVPVTTMEAPEADRKGVPVLGVYIDQELEFDDAALTVEIHSGAITGPSAGLMFTLQIIDQLTPGGLVPDLVVAGTGTIEPDGSVGAIGGVQQKVYTAEAAGAKIMFVPRENYDDARAVATRVEVVPVDTITDALVVLQQIRENGEEAGHSSPAFWS